MPYRQPLNPIRKWTGIGIFSERGTTCVIYTERNQPKKFASYTQANDYIQANHLGDNASPVEVYEG